MNEISGWISTKHIPIIEDDFPQTWVMWVIGRNQEDSIILWLGSVDQVRREQVSPVLVPGH